MALTKDSKSESSKLLPGSSIGHRFAEVQIAILSHRNRGLDRALQYALPRIIIPPRLLKMVGTRRRSWTISKTECGAYRELIQETWDSQIRRLRSRTTAHPQRFPPNRMAWIEPKADSGNS